MPELPSSFLLGRTQPQGPELRRSARYEPSPQALTHLWVRLQDYSGSVRIGDISTTGVSLVVNRRFDVGSLLHIEIVHALRNVAWYGIMRVIHIERQTSERFLLGGALITKFTTEEVEALVL